MSTRMYIADYEQIVHLNTILLIKINNECTFRVQFSPYYRP